MSLFQISYLLTLLLTIWQFRVSQSLEVCCCPDLTLSLSAVESDSTKSLQNGFLFVAKEDSTVTLKCELGDKDHKAIKSVEYKFHKTYQLGTTKPISLDTKNKELCKNNLTSLNTCNLTDVKFTENPLSSGNMDSADNHIYQCYAEITLVDNAVVKLWSHTIKLDVYYPPIKSSKPKSDPRSVSTGKALEKFICKLPDSNPKTKARWSFKRGANDKWEVIDIPYDKVRGERLVIAEDDISLLSKDDVDRGMLLLMIFDPSEDEGYYKCEGVYDTEFDDQDETFDISLYEVKSNDQKDVGDLLLRTVSAITEPKLVNQDSTVNFTVYARDTPGREKFGDVSYTWQIKGDQDVDVDFTKYHDLTLSNHGRTLTVANLTRHRDHEFHCKMRRNTNGRLEEITSDPLGIATSAVIIAPKYLSIPITSRTCVNLGDNLKATPNKSYMMSDPALAAVDPHQILLKADSFKFYINDYKVIFISDNDDNFDRETEAGVTQKKFAEELPENANDRCVYWQYLRGYGLQYQLIEVMRTDRLANKGFNKIDFQAICDSADIEVADSTVNVTFTGIPIKTAQCLKMDVVDRDNKTLYSKSRSVTAESCITSMFNETWQFTDIPARDGLKVNVYSECFPGGGCSISPISSGGCQEYSVITMIVAVMVALVLGNQDRTFNIYSGTRWTMK